MLEAYEKHPQSLDTILDRNADVQRLEQRDRRFVVEIFFGVVRMKLSLDFTIHHFLQTERLKHNEALVRLLRIGAYQILYMERVPDHASVNETVKLAKGIPRLVPCAGVVNAVLRNIIKSKGSLPHPATSEPLDARLAIEYSHPQWLVRRWLDRLGLARTKSLLVYNNTRPEIYLRRKIKGMSRQQFDAESRSISEPAKGYMNLFYRLRKSIVPDSIRLLQDGYCTVQSPSSGWVVAMLEPQAGERVLDVCAAPGGKTSLIAELVGERGGVYGCDIKAVRLGKVAQTAKRMVLRNIRCIVGDGERLPFAILFDRVLLDAPCSATGVLQRHPDARWNRGADHIEKMALLQSRLLAGVCTAVKPGGVLVYATCSLEPEENEEQVRSFLALHPEFSLERPPSCIPGTYVSDDGYMRITPYEHKADGMFAARLRRAA